VKRLVVRGGVVLVAVALGFLGVFDGKALKFNDKLVDELTAVNDAFEPVVYHLDAYSENKKVDVAGFEEAVRSAKQEVAKRLTTIQKAKGPSGNEALDLRTVCVSYTENSEALLGFYLDEVLPYIVRHNPGSEKDVEKIEEMMTPYLEKDFVLFSAVQTAQKVFAEKHDFKLK
jgi:hypothetical protein